MAFYISSCFQVLSDSQSQRCDAADQLCACVSIANSRLRASMPGDALPPEEPVAGRAPVAVRPGVVERWRSGAAWRARANLCCASVTARLVAKWQMWGGGQTKASTISGATQCVAYLHASTTFIYARCGNGLLQPASDRHCGDECVSRRCDRVSPSSSLGRHGFCSVEFARTLPLAWWPGGFTFVSFPFHFVSLSLCKIATHKQQDAHPAGIDAVEESSPGSEGRCPSVGLAPRTEVSAHKGQPFHIPGVAQRTSSKYARSA